MSSPWLKEALATRDLERVTANMAAGGERINDARRHIRFVLEETAESHTVHPGDA